MAQMVHATGETRYTALPSAEVTSSGTLQKCSGRASVKEGHVRAWWGLQLSNL